MKRTLVLCVLAFCSISYGAQDHRVAKESLSIRQPPPIVYKVAPSDTDNGTACPAGQGCKQRWELYAEDDDHVLYVPVSTKTSGKRLVFFGGAGSKPDNESSHRIYAVAASQGYHVISVSYFTENDSVPNVNSCAGSLPLDSAVEASARGHRRESGEG